MNLDIIDIIILLIIVISAIYGAFKGFISQLVSIVSLLLGVWCAFKFASYVSGYIKNLFAIGETAVYIIAFIIILLVVIILCTFIGKGIEKIVSFTMLNWLNRLLGILFCAIKSVVIMSIVVFLLNYADKTWDLIPNSLFSNSIFYPHLEGLSEKIFPYLQSLIR